jgi:hypothetical protein
MRVTQGTASVPASGTVVTGSGTAWLSAGIVPGMSIFTVDGVVGHQARVARVEGDAVLHLAEPWTGGTQSAAGYAVTVDFTPLGMPLVDETAVELSALFNAAMARIEAGLIGISMPLAMPLPRIDETTANVPELWNSALDLIEARIGSIT